MPRLPDPLPRRRSEVTLQAVGNGEFVVKDRKTRAYFRIGAIEHFLLSHLDGTHTAREIRDKFRAEFNERLGESDLADFLSMARGQGLLESSDPADEAGSAKPVVAEGDDDDEISGQSWLFFRKSLIDPEKLMAWLEPQVRFLWTMPFLVLSLAAMLLAGWTLWTHREDLVAGFSGTVRWETVAIVWITLVLVTTLHEFAHGLTCKHYGGEVHELGVLMIFFMPCFYCDVSDAWLIPQKSRRLLVTLAGSYSDLCVWAVTVFLWRITIPDSLPHYVVTVVMSTCGTRVFLNLNPFLRLDGYYFIADLLEIPNLRARARDYWMSHLRWLLWGASRPAAQTGGKWLLLYGGATWGMALLAMDFLLIGLWRFVIGNLGVIGAVVSLLLMTFVSRRVFKGLLESEVITMLKTRPVRTAVWAALIVGGPTAAFLIPYGQTANGAVEIRSGRKVEVHAAVAGFLREIKVEEGAEVSTADCLARLDVPDLDSLTRRKQADIAECDATLTKLRSGARPEQLREERNRISRAEAWVNLARSDLERARLSQQHTMVQLDQAIWQSQTELSFANKSLVRSQNLYRVGALAGEQLRAEQKKVMLLRSQLTQAEAEKRAKQADGLRLAEAELARREKELAEARSSLKLLEAGSRPEEIKAEEARRQRLTEELRFLESESGKQCVKAPADGVISTPRMNEKDGVYFEKGALICNIEDMSQVTAEISIEEDSIQGVTIGQSIELKVRSLPFQTFTAKVERIAPAASNPVPNRSQSLVKVLCRVQNQEGKLKAGMTGFARIHRGTDSLGMMWLSRGLKELRTEFWW